MKNRRTKKPLIVTVLCNLDRGDTVTKVLALIGFAILVAIVITEMMK
jgi:hypothetical protein